MIETKKLSDEINVKLTLVFPIIALIAIISTVGVYFYSQKFVDRGIVLGTKTSVSNAGLFSNQVRLIKTVNDPRVYAVVGQQKHLLRNEEVFYSYDFNFRNIEIVSQRELDNYQLARLVKDVETGRVYYLNYAKNLKKYHPTPEGFASYRGNKWEDVLDISGVDVKFWEEAALVKTLSSSKVYYVTGAKKAWVPSVSEFTNAGWQWNKIMTVSQGDLNTYEEVEYNISLVREGGASATPINKPVLGAQLIATLDRSSPTATLFPFATENNLVAAFRLQAVRGAITVNGITLTKQGFLKNERIRSITIEDENGVVFGQRSSVSNDHTATIRFNKTKFIIPSNSEKTLRVKISFADGQEINNKVSFGIASAEDINTNTNISGIFPIFGQSHKLVAANELIGRVAASSVSINNELRDVSIGVSKELVAKFRLSETSENEKVAIEKIIFTNKGSARDENLDNIRLYKEKKLLTTNRDMINNRVIFDLTDKNLILDRGETVEFNIKVDVMKGDDKTLKFVIDDHDDLQVKGVTQGFNIMPTGSFPVGQGSSSGYNKVIFKREGIGIIARKLKEKDREVYREQPDAILADYELRNIKQDIFFQRFKLKINKFKGASNIDSDVIVKDVSNDKVIATIRKNQVADGAVVDFTIGDYKVAANKTIKLAVIADIPETAQSNSVYQVVITEVSYKIGLDNTEYTQTRESRGQLMVVYAPKLTIAPEDLYYSGQAEGGEEKQELARFNLAASVDEKIKVTSITVTLTKDSDDSTYISGFSDLTLYTGKTGKSRKSNIIAQPDSRTYTFNDLKIRVSPGKNISLTVKADVETIAIGKKVRFKIDNIEAEGYSSHAPVIVNGEGTISQPVTIVEVEEEE